MPILYLAKVNINSSIFDIYDHKVLFKDVFNVIYRNIDNGHLYCFKKKEKFMDSMGNESVYVRESEYSFQEIQKYNNGIIMGKVARKYNKPSEKIDENSGKMKQVFVEEGVSILFYYDVYREMITFCERQSFGYNQFMDAFRELLNNCVQLHTFEIFLQKDKNILDQKLKKLKTVSKIKATLIPPNSNEDELDELRKELEYMNQCQDANAKKVKLEYDSDNMKMNSKIIQDIKKAVSYGYGDITVRGTNYSGRSQIVSSSQDAAYTADVGDNIDYMMYGDESKALINRFIANKKEKN